ncbi:hypothetical protein D3C77_666980 [compost metagenome]
MAAEVFEGCFGVSPQQHGHPLAGGQGDTGNGGGRIEVPVGLRVGSGRAGTTAKGGQQGEQGSDHAGFHGGSLVDQ